jgi:hypothetical protein
MLATILVIAHRDLGPRSVWAASPTRVALGGLMTCQLPEEESLGDWSSVLRGHTGALPEDADRRLAGTAKQRDVHALGRLAFQILTGCTPPAEPTAAAAMLSALPDLAPWFARTTARDAPSRYADARDMADEFAAVVDRSQTEGIDQNRHVERVFDPSRKDHHRGRRKLRVIGDELFAVNFGETARTNEATLGASYIFLLPFCDTNPATQNGAPTECTLSSRKCCCLSSARLRWRRSCMQACILASTLQVFRRKCPLDERKTRRREPAPSPLIVRTMPRIPSCCLSADGRGRNPPRFLPASPARWRI